MISVRLAYYNSYLKAIYKLYPNILTVTLLLTFYNNLKSFEYLSIPNKRDNRNKELRLYTPITQSSIN
jgi:hypothetical protein